MNSLLLVTLVRGDLLGQCDCSWTSPVACGNSDGSYCWNACCGGANYPQANQPAPVQPAPAQSGHKCDCSWTNPGCGGQPNDGSYCWSECCGGGGQGGGDDGNHGRRAQAIPNPDDFNSWPQPANFNKPEWTGMAKTTRYWDCCKPSCSWPGQRGVQGNPVRACTRDGGTADPNAPNVCGGGGDRSKGTAYTCVNNQPFTANGLMYAFVAGGGHQLSTCCSCFELEFTEGSPLAWRRMIVQVTNTGGDLAENQFDIMMPGGGFGIFDGCAEGNQNGPAQFNRPPEAWGHRYGGVDSANECGGLPEALQSGCHWHFWDQGFQNAQNPQARFREVQCPRELTDISGCGHNRLKTSGPKSNSTHYTNRRNTTKNYS